MDRGVKRAVIPWHRRSGKDLTCLNYTVKAMFERVGAYYHLFPQFGQARRVIWDGRDKDGVRFLDHFPPELIKSKHENELKITLVNGSIYQLIGTDNFDNIVGANPIGCVFSEYSLQDPMAWELLRPILRENGGWAIFDSTPRGHNHFWELFKVAEERVAAGDSSWFCQLLTVEDTGAISKEDVEAERREGMDEELLQQEYYCSWSGSQQGSYYSKQMDAAEKDGRIARVPYQPELGVHTWWDLGIADAMAVTFTQNAGREVHIIDYYENSGGGLPACALELQKRGYVYASHNAPHDIKVRELGSGKSRLETAASLGIKFEEVPNIGLADGIDATRSFLSRCWFDKAKTERLRNALVSYHKTWDEKRKCFSDTPFRDWSTHAADSVRYLSVGHKLGKAETAQRIERTGRLSTQSGGATWMGN
jgi:phage terminase large subunit